MTTPFYISLREPDSAQFILNTLNADTYIHRVPGTFLRTTRPMQPLDAVANTKRHSGTGLVSIAVIVAWGLGEKRSGRGSSGCAATHPLGEGRLTILTIGRRLPICPTAPTQIAIAAYRG